MKALKLLAARTSQLLNVSEVATQMGVKSPITQDWINLLEENLAVKRFQSVLLLNFYSPNFTENLKIGRAHV